MSRRRYFEEQRSGNGAIYHCVEIDTDHDNRFEVLDLMSKDESDTISPDKVNNVLNQLRQGSCFNIHTQSTVSFEVIEKRSNAIFIKFNPTPAPSEQHGIIYRFQINLKSATKLFSVLLASKRPLITELADKLRLKYPLLPTISPCPTMRLEAIRSIIPISCRRYPKSV